MSAGSFSLNGNIEISVDTAGTLMSNGITYIGNGSHSQALVRVEGVGSTFFSTSTSTGHFSVGRIGQGTVEILDGAELVTAGIAYLGETLTGTGHATVSGYGSKWSSSNAVRVGGHNSQSRGNGILEVRDGGEIVLASGAITLWQTGTLTGGGGLVQANVINHGVVAPGNSPGLLTIDGNFTQMATGILEMELGGTGMGEFDVLRVLGNVNLDGGLSLSLINGYTPNEGDVFQILETSGVLTGAFFGLAEGDVVATFGHAMFHVTYQPSTLHPSLQEGVALYVVIPELSAFSLMAISGILCLVFWGVRKKT